MNRKLLIALLYAISATYTLQAADRYDYDNDEVNLFPFSTEDLKGKAYAKFEERCAAYAAANKKPKEEIVTTQEEIDYWAAAGDDELEFFCFLRNIPNPLKAQKETPKAPKILAPSPYELEREAQARLLTAGLPTNTPPSTGRTSKASSSKDTSRTTTPLNVFRPIDSTK